jgi:hypothetical protein
MAVLRVNPDLDDPSQNQFEVAAYAAALAKFTKEDRC